jgi:hypothetical protein
MLDFKKCEVCKEYHWTDEKCAPEYFVYHEEYMGDKAKSIRACSHEDASIKYGEYYNQDDYSLMNETIQIKVEKDGEIKFFKVEAELCIQYSSNEIDKLDSN